MTDFIKAFEQGQRAAEQAIESKAEINEVIRSLAQELMQATDGKLEIGIADSSSLSFDVWGSFTTGVKSKPPIPGGIVKPQAIYARNLKAINTDLVTLAKWERPHQGYPCVIAFNGREIGCHDREALERALAEMLQNAWVGEQLRALLERPLKSTSMTEGDGIPPEQPPSDT
jgi:hypothetical protein